MGRVRPGWEGDFVFALYPGWRPLGRPYPGLLSGAGFAVLGSSALLQFDKRAQRWLDVAMKWQSMLALLAVPALLALLMGCDPVYGVSHTAHLKTMPNPAVVGDVIRSVPGVQNVDYHQSEGGRPLTITGIHAPDQVHTFIYTGSNIWCCLLLIFDYKGTVEFSQGLNQMGKRPPQLWIDATRPVMKEVEVQLEQRCGLWGLSTNVVEWCHGVRCK